MKSKKKTKKSKSKVKKTKSQYKSIEFKDHQVSEGHKLFGVSERGEYLKTKKSWFNGFLSIFGLKRSK